ncbi:aminopeptidase [Oleidesulfovibrio sp.]|uniref:aminopeptidase n=1 Tax=Oleidesulfovibrio sp. TaxID=2909707 RepID=UPI003A874F66
MYTPDELEKYADVMLWGLRRGKKSPLAKSSFILVRFHLPALPLAEELCARIHDQGMIPIARMLPTPRMEHDIYTKANRKRLTTILPGERDLYNHLHGVISLLAPESMSHLADVDPENLAIYQQARQPLQSIARIREDMGAFGWTLCIYPTQAQADAAGLTLDEYAQEIKKACLLTEGSPVHEWRMLVKHAEEIRSWLNSMDIVSLRVESENIDLLVGMGERRNWAGITGRNIPSFEMYVSPDCRATEGVYYADLPSYRSGNVVEGIRLEFTSGRATKLTAHKGERFATEQLNSDQGAALLGEFALVDKRFSRINKFMANTLFDENHGGRHGSMHIALGQSYANTFDGPPEDLTPEMKRQLGLNTSTLHWDLVNTEPKHVTALLRHGEKRTIYQNGQFTL